MRDFVLGKDEAVTVNGNIEVTVIDIDGDGDEVIIAIDTPEWMGIEETGEIESFQDIELASTG